MARDRMEHDRRDRIGKGLAVSVVFHLLVLALLGATAMHFEQDRPPEPIYDVTLMGASGSASPSSAPAPASAPAAQASAPAPVHPPAPNDIIEKKPVPEATQPTTQPTASPATEQPSPATPMGNEVKSEGTGEKGAQTVEGTDKGGAQTGEGSGEEGEQTGTGDSLPPASDDIEAPTVPPGVLSSRAPEYPYSAQNRGTEGTVVICFLLDKEGNVDDMEIVESSGSNDLDRAAMKAAAGFAFSPGMDGYGRPVRCYVYQSFTFQLE